MNISSRNESYEAYTGNSLQAAGRAACSLSNSAPKCENVVATHLTLWQPTLMQSLLARLHQTAGVKERGTEKETCFGTSEARIPPQPTGEGHNQQKEGCLSECWESDHPTVLRDGSAGHTGTGMTTQRSLHRKHIPERRSG